MKVSDMDVTNVITRHHIRNLLRNAMNLNMKVPDMYVTSVSIWHHIRDILSNTKYINMKLPIIHVSKYTIVRNVIKLLKVSRVWTFTQKLNLKLSNIYVTSVSIKHHGVVI